MYKLTLFALINGEFKDIIKNEEILNRDVAIIVEDALESSVLTNSIMTSLHDVVFAPMFVNGRYEVISLTESEFWKYDKDRFLYHEVDEDKDFDNLISLPSLWCDCVEGIYLDANEVSRLIVTKVCDILNEEMP